MKCRVKRHAVVQPLDQSYRLIPLTQGQNAIVDTEDFDWLNQWNWAAEFDPRNERFYAKRKDQASGKVSMHALILDCKQGEWGDHKDGDTLHNRRSNLRKCEPRQNNWNRRVQRRNKTGYKGVSVERAKWGHWRARIRIGRKLLHLGYFITPEDAARAYNEAAIKLHGEFAWLNELTP